MTPVLFVLAGVNGAGKSSLCGPIIRRSLNYFNPDEAAARIREALSCSIDRVNALAWAEGKLLLEKAIRERINHAFETTLGGSTMPRLIAAAADAGFDNSDDRDRETGIIPPPWLLLHWKRGGIFAPPLTMLESTPEWAKPIVARALQLRRVN